MNGWCKPKRGAAYGGAVSEKTFRSWMKNGLRYTQLPSGTILTRYQWIDEFLEGYEAETGPNCVDEIVDDALKGLR